MANERPAAALPLLFCIFLTVFMSGCSTMRPVDTESGELVLSVVEHGDEVKITMHDDSAVQFVVTEIDEHTIVGNGQTIALEDIRELQIKKLNVPATVGLIVGLTTIGIQAIGAAAGFVPPGY